MNNVTQSFTKALRDKMQTFVYDRASIKTDEEISVTNKIRILSTDTSLILLGLQDGIDAEKVKNRYLRYNDMYIRIIDYDSLNYTVILEKPFGIEIDENSDMDIVFYDNIFIDYKTINSQNSQIARGNIFSQLVIIYIKTFNDEYKLKMGSFLEKFDDLIIGNGYNLEVLDFKEGSPTYGQKISNMIIKNNIQKDDISYMVVKTNFYCEYKIALEISYKIQF